MRIAQDLSISRVRKAGKSSTVRNAAKFTRVDLAGRDSAPPVVTRASVPTLSLGAGERLAPAALKANWMAKWGQNDPKWGQNGDFCGNMLRYLLWRKSFIAMLLR